MSEAQIQAAQRIIEFKPNVKQILFLQAKRRYVGFGGARGGGKSWAIDCKGILLANRWAGIKILIVRRTLVELRNNHIEPLKRMLHGIARYNQQERKFIFGNGSTITFEYYDSDKDGMKYQGVEYDVIFIDEATQLQEEWLKIIATCCRGVNGYPKRIYHTCNPGGPGHGYIKRIYIDRKYQTGENPEDYEFIQSLVTDNIALMATNPEYKVFLESLPPKLKMQWLYGDWNVAEGMFFEGFRDNPEGYDTRQWTHVINPFKPPAHWPIYRSFDWGYGKPFSTGWWAVDENGVNYRILEMYGVQYSGEDPIPNVGVKWPPDTVFRKMAQFENEHPWLKGKKITGIADRAIWDAESGISIAETATKYGIYFNPSDSERIPGWMQVQYRLMFDEDGFPQMYIFRNCKNTIRTLPLLEFDKHQDGDLDTDGEDHAADEIRYFSMWRPCKPPVLQEKEHIDWTQDPLEQMVRGRRA